MNGEPRKTGRRTYGEKSGPSEEPVNVGQPIPVKLSATLLAILELMANGKTTKEIAEILHKSTKTVDAQRGQIYDKLGAFNGAQAISMASKLGLIGKTPN